MLQNSEETFYALAVPKIDVDNRISKQLVINNKIITTMTVNEKGFLIRKVSTRI